MNFRMITTNLVVSSLVSLIFGLPLIQKVGLQRDIGVLLVILFFLALFTNINILYFDEMRGVK